MIQQSTPNLRYAIEQRRAERRSKQEEEFRNTRAAALCRAKEICSEFVAVLERFPEVVRVLDLFGVSPADAQVEPLSYLVHLSGTAILDGRVIAMSIYPSTKGSGELFNVECACEQLGWERQYRAHTINTLADDLLNAAEELLVYIEAQEVA